MTPIGSFSAMGSEQATVPARSELAGRAGDRHHLLLAQGLQQGVRDPVDGLRRPPGDKPQPVALEVQLELAALDRALLGRAVEDRRVHPARPLDAVVLADDRRLQHHSVALLALAAGRQDLVDARRADVLEACDANGRVVDRESAARALLDRLDRLVLAELRLLLEAARLRRALAPLRLQGAARALGV